MCVVPWLSSSFGFCLKSYSFNKYQTITLNDYNLILNLYKINLELPFLLSLIFVAIFPSMGSYYFWFSAISIIGANRSGIFLHLMPIFSAIMAMIIGGFVGAGMTLKLYWYKIKRKITGN